MTMQDKISLRIMALVSQGQDVKSAIEATKFIIADYAAIWGCGDTEDVAWADLRRGMTLAKIPHQSEVDTEDAYCPKYWHEDQFQAIPATAALVADVEERGGRIEFAVVKGIACTEDEEEAFKAP